MSLIDWPGRVERTIETRKPPGAQNLTGIRPNVEIMHMRSATRLKKGCHSGAVLSLPPSLHLTAALNLKWQDVALHPISGLGLLYVTLDEHHILLLVSALRTGFYSLCVCAC